MPGDLATKNPGRAMQAKNAEKMPGDHATRNPGHAKATRRKVAAAERRSRRRQMRGRRGSAKEKENVTQRGEEKRANIIGKYGKDRLTTKCCPSTSSMKTKRPSHFSLSPLIERPSLVQCTFLPVFKEKP